MSPQLGQIPIKSLSSSRPISSLNLSLQAISTLIIIYLLIQVSDENLHWHSSTLKQVANFLPAASLYGLFLGLTRRLWMSTLLTAGICLLIFNAHKLKLEHLNQPLQFADIFLVWQTITNWELLSHYAPPLLIPALILSIIILVTLFKFEKSFKWTLGLPMATASLLSLYAIGSNAYSPDDLYGSFAHDSLPWESESVAKKQGLIASLTSGARSAKLTLPNPDKSLLSNFLKAYPPPLVEKNHTLQHPDIILWLSESFFDPGIIENISTCSYLPIFCELLNQHAHSNIEVPTFGGNTTRTEFEVLTSVPFKNLGIQDYPYISVVHKKTYSIAWALKSLGYETTAIHPNQDSMWQRNRALPLLGFDKFISHNDFSNPERDGIWISDAELVRSINTQLELPESQRPQFIFAISMEGHGPYSKSKVLDSHRRDLITAPNRWSSEAISEWRKFIYHAQNASHAMNTLKDKIIARKRPTLVVIFGDHLPNLKHVFEQSGFKNGKKPWQQLTPALAFANYPIDNSWLPDASHELGVWTLNLAGVVEETEFSTLNHALKIAKHSDQKDAYASAIQALKFNVLHTRVLNEP